MITTKRTLQFALTCVVEVVRINLLEVCRFSRIQLISCNYCAADSLCARSNLGTGRIATTGGKPNQSRAHNRSTVFAGWRQCARLFVWPTPLTIPTGGWICSAVLDGRCRYPRRSLGSSTYHFKRHLDQSAVFPEFTIVTDGRTDRPSERTRNSVRTNRPDALYTCDAA